MSPATRKKALLGVLIIVLVYVWWDGFHLMYPSATGFAVVTTGPAGRAPTPGPYSQIEYREPQTNPFYRPVKNPTTETSQRRGANPASTPLLRSAYRLVGVLGRGKQSQAVIKSDQLNTVVSIGDSLGGWELTAINENHAVFKHDKQRDTLWLYQNAH